MISKNQCCVPRGQPRGQNVWHGPRLGFKGMSLALSSVRGSVPRSCPWPRRSILKSSGREQDDREFPKILVEMKVKPSSKRKTMINCSYLFFRIDPQQFIFMGYRPINAKHIDFTATVAFILSS